MEIYKEILSYWSSIFASLMLINCWSWSHLATCWTDLTISKCSWSNYIKYLCRYLYNLLGNHNWYINLCWVIYWTEKYCTSQKVCKGGNCIDSHNYIIPDYYNQCFQNSNGFILHIKWRSHQSILKCFSLFLISFNPWLNDLLLTWNIQRTKKR